MAYHLREKKKGRRLLKYFAFALLLLIVTGAVAGALWWQSFQKSLQPVGGGGKPVSVTVEQGDSLASIADNLSGLGLIKSAQSFEYYARIHRASRYLQAGTYEISPAQSVPEIVQQLTGGKVATSLVTILPGQRLDQIRQGLINQGFSADEVDNALEPSQYRSRSVFEGKPAGTNLEGYLYPDSFQRTKLTEAKSIVEQSLDQMQNKLTKGVIAGFERQGVSVYEGIVIASIVEKEVVVQAERAQAAQVFLARLRIGMPLGSDVTAHYGSVLAGKGKDVTYDTPYNTRIHTGLPPTPISNVSQSSLDAVANPANTDWLFFVTGDDGVTHFSKTVAEHEALAAKYCHKLCQE
ncbi:endolytic transglycosylase MltG [Candidatus Saccharibacteria bacterium]|nr:endolytic transglycosylase MltG [Candidatus Saccharibacteria bacterium]